MTDTVSDTRPSSEGLQELPSSALIMGLYYSSAEVGVVNKIIGLWLTIGGALLGGALMLKLGLYRALMLFGVLQMASNVGFWWLATEGKGQIPGLTIPAFDIGIVQLAQATPVDGGLLLVIAAENISGGMGTAAFVALLMALCNLMRSAHDRETNPAAAATGAPANPPKPGPAKPTRAAMPAAASSRGS